MYPNNQLQTTPPQKPRTLRRIVLIIGVILIALGVGLHVYKLINAPTCFTASDYVEFYGSAPTDVTFEPGAQFFNAAYSFLPNSTTLDAAESEASPEEDVANLAAFYKKHSSKQVAFVIQAAYAAESESNKAIVEKRTENIKKMLTDAGIATDLITTKIEAYDITDEAIDYDDVDSVSLLLTSTEGCRE